MGLCLFSVLRGHRAAAARAGLRARHGPGPHAPVQSRGCGALLRGFPCVCASVVFFEGTTPLLHALGCARAMGLGHGLFRAGGAGPC